MATLRGAIVGFGFIAENGHLPAYLAHGDRFSIIAVADACAARRERARALLPGVMLFEDHRDMLAALGGRLDFVDIATPPSEHEEIALDALEAGLHVFCEKPLATSAEAARRMLQAAQQRRRVLMPSHNYRHAPVVRAVRRALDAGVVGEVKLVTMQTFRPTHARGVSEWRPDWRRERRYAGGGIAMDHGSHTFYLAFDWFNAYPTSISARTWSSSGDTEDNATCALTFPGGGVATAHLSWTAGVRRVLYTIHGNQGAIRVEDDDIEISTVAGRAASGAPNAWETTRESVSSDWMNAGHPVWFVPLLVKFAIAIARRQYVTDEARDSLRCVELIMTGYRSAQQGSIELRLSQHETPAPSLAVPSHAASVP
jgi:predicted dehydrogenase